ncbi:PAQR family membrane homeostasis protein TrhA [Mycobacterium sp. C31M]
MTVDLGKPRMRGWIHAAFVPVVLAAGTVLVCLAPDRVSRWAVATYAVATLLLFTTSAVYHVGTWTPGAERLLRRLDHTNIYLIIAASYTPIALGGLDDWRRQLVLVVVWGAAAAGVAFRWMWTDAPRSVSTSLYVLVGWSIAPFLGEVISTDVTAGVLTIVGGSLYTVGAVAYATRWPDPHPGWFGYHEVFHLFTAAAWICQYIAIVAFTLR